MASNVNINDLLGSVPISDIASEFGVDEATAKQAVQQALPGLLGGMAVNASHEDGAGKLTAALKKHEGAEIKGLKAVDTADGQKIVNHVLGDKQDAVARTLGQQSGGGIGDLIPKLLPILAPIVMSFLAKQMGGGSAANDSSAGSSSGGIGDLLGGLLGGASGSGSDDGLGDLLGGLLGGGSSSGSNSSGGLGGLLGGLLGGR